MSELRGWNKIWVEIIDKELNKLSLHGERSDYEQFKVIINIDPIMSAHYIMEKYKKAVDILEGFRNCDCTAKGGECVKHLTSINTGFIPETIVRNNPYLRKVVDNSK